MSPHELGLIGDGLNLFGALTLALDIFLRQREQRRKEALDHVSRAAREASLSRTEYKGYSLISPDFSERVLNRTALARAYTGVGLMVFGFTFQALYHLFAMGGGARLGP